MSRTYKFWPDALWLNNNFYWWTREWPYKNVKPRILADKLLDDHTGKTLRDYKFWCFNGEPKYMYCTVKSDDMYENFYDMDFHPVAINPFVRIDFFWVEGKVYFGEFTFYDWAGLRPFADYQQDLELGELILLPKRS